jgi:serine/threonine protein kinase
MASGGDSDVLFNNRYRILGKLGRGAFGQVFKVKDEQDSDIPMYNNF